MDKGEKFFPPTTDYIDSAADAMDRACEDRGFDTITQEELAHKAAELASKHPVTSRSPPSSPAFDHLGQPAPQPRIEWDVASGLQNRVELLEEKLAIVWSLLKMKPEEKDNATIRS